MKTIIVPTDFSPAAVNAMNYAADMATEINASILLVNIYQVPIAMTDAPLVMVSIDELKEGAEQKLETLKAGLERVTSGKIKIYTEAILGDPVDELQALCEKINPFAVVMGSLGHSSFERSLFGSTTLSAIRNITSPVIAVPVGKEYGTGIKKIGLAADFRHVAETTPVDVIRNIVKEFKAGFHVLNVDYRENHLRPETAHESALLDAAFQELKPQYHFIEHKDIEDGINEFAENNNLDLIISIPKKHKLLEELFKKSSTRQLVFESKVPVMCVHE